jgi:hypothetical protein
MLSLLRANILVVQFGEDVAATVKKEFSKILSICIDSRIQSS